MSLWASIAGTVGDTWADWSSVAVWPWPAVVVGMRHGEMLWSDYRAFTRLLKPGDFLLTRSAPFFGSNAAIPGSFKHLAVYVGAVKGQQNSQTHFIENASALGVEHQTAIQPPRGVYQRCCVHAISEGVVCQDFGEVLMHADYALAVRPWGRKSEQEIIVKAAAEQIGKPYDFAFKENNIDAFYCTELGLHCCRRAAIIEPLLVPLRLRLFRRKIPVALADYFTKYHPVCCSESCLDRGFQRKSQLGGAFEQSILNAWAAR